MTSNVKKALKNKANNSNQELAKKEEPKTMRQWIKAMEPEIKKALPSVITPERFTRLAVTAITVNPKLAQCNPTSFMGALMNAAQLGLEPNTSLGQAYLIPFKNNKLNVLECQFQIGYKGLIDLAHRSGEFRSIQAHEVYENDEFEYEYGLEPKLVHKPVMKDRGEVYCYYAVYRLKNGGTGFEVMSKEDVVNHAKKFSQSFNSTYSPWSNNFDEMAKKTILKKVLKYAPIKVDFQRKVAEDATIKSELSSDMSEVPNENVFEAEYEIDGDEEDSKKDDNNDNEDQLKGQTELQ